MLIDAGGIREVEHGVPTRAELHALIDRRQKTAAPARISAARTLCTGTEHHEGRQIARLTAQPIQYPRPHARAAALLRAGVHEKLSSRMVERGHPTRPFRCVSRLLATFLNPPPQRRTVS